MVELAKLSLNSEIWLKFKNLVLNSEVWWMFQNLLKFQNLVEISKFSKNSEICSKFAQNYDEKFMSRSLVPQIEV